MSERIAGYEAARVIMREIVDGKPQIAGEDLIKIKAARRAAMEAQYALQQAQANYSRLLDTVILDYNINPETEVLSVHDGSITKKTTP